MKLKLYHGTSDKNTIPSYDFLSNKSNDFGKGFYLTDDLELAKEWSARENSSITYVFEFELETSNLKELNILSPTKINTWIALLLFNRPPTGIKNEISNVIVEYFTKKYLPSLNHIDYITAWRADDQYFNYMRAFCNNSLSIEILKKAMQLGYLGKQVFIYSKKAFENLKMVKIMEIDAKKYMLNKQMREEVAKQQFDEIRKTSILEGTYALDIVKNEK